MQPIHWHMGPQLQSCRRSVFPQAEAGVGTETVWCGGGGGGGAVVVVRVVVAAGVGVGAQPWEGKPGSGVGGCTTT